ncbi:MAG: type II secretion system F family protein [Acidimicrobiia bacterium]
MTTHVIVSSLGLAIGGPIGGLIGWFLVWAVSRVRRPSLSPEPHRLVLLLTLVELRSGRSVLAALQKVAESLPSHRSLQRVARVATVSGLTSSITHAGPNLQPLIAQLARAQRSGASLSDTVRHLLDKDLAEEKARRLASARSLPVKLMVPVALLMLPGLVLMLYAPSLVRLFTEITGTWK